MIVIFAPAAENTINKVAENLLYIRSHILRIAELKLFKESEYKCDLLGPSLKNITSFWYRKGQDIFYDNLFYD